MFRPLSHQLAQDRGLQTHTGELELDPQLVAQSFGVAYPPNEPLPETNAPEDSLDGLILNERAPRRKPPVPLLSIAIERLQSVKPQSPQRQKELTKMIAKIYPTLRAVDALYALLEQEHFQSVSNRWEEIRVQGRALNDALPAFDKALGEARNFCNLSEEAKHQRHADLEQRVAERERISKWSTQREIEVADERVEKAKAAAASAREKALQRQEEFWVAKNKLLDAKNNLRLLGLKLQGLAAEMAGRAYHDPQTGLLVDPQALQDPIETKNLSDALNKYYAVRQ
jgi:hypothetical protein